MLGDLEQLEQEIPGDLIEASIEVLRRVPVTSAFAFQVAPHLRPARAVINAPATSHGCGYSKLF